MSINPLDPLEYQRGSYAYTIFCNLVMATIDSAGWTGARISNEDLRNLAEYSACYFMKHGFDFNVPAN